MKSGLKRTVSMKSRQMDENRLSDRSPSENYGSHKRLHSRTNSSVRVSMKRLPTVGELGDPPEESPEAVRERRIKEIVKNVFGSLKQDVIYN